MPYHTVKSIIKDCKKKKIAFWEAVLREQSRESGESETAVFEKMQSLYIVMKQSLADYDKNAFSPSKMAGGNGEKIAQYNKNGENLLGKFMSDVVENAVKIAESNACMKRIVAAPTAGSCGVLPAVLIAYQNKYGVSDSEITKALFVSAGIGAAVAENASISGAQGGCQAEIGTASAMAAGALTFLLGGNGEAAANAAALALKNMLGLVCDPVKGLVEVPCIKRNASGAVNSVLCAQLSLSGVKSAISFDQVISAMDEIGRNMPECYRETSKGGLALCKLDCQDVMN